MSSPSFDTFFYKATEKSPYGYQCRLACGPDAKLEEPASLERGTNCKSQLIDIPTGLGKTAAVVLAWLWNRVAQPDEAERQKWPRRLVYCLPMRTLVEQTEAEARKWLEKHGLLWDNEPGTRKGKVGVHILMGGEDSGEWDIYPEENAILIGTQDMLLSRALNRGYGMSRYRWPMHFGLLNNDCLWVMDETQLMGVGVETSAQLDGFRHDEKILTFGACPTWWMSATLESERLDTVDHQKPAHVEKLSDAEQASGGAHDLIVAPKKLSPAPLALNSTTKNNYAKRLAELVAGRHQELIKNPHPTGTLTLVIVNRVLRAREIYEALTRGERKGKQTIAPLYPLEKVALIHSRFRPVDRERHTKLLFGTGDRIVIATQAVEAGVDVSARLVITELAPWSSLVQRMGRCNRRADIPDAEVLWVSIEPDAKGELLLPYKADELDKARTALSNPSPLTHASPLALAERGKMVEMEKVIRPVIRRRDLVDLFDTTPDICGQDLDISRYIRDGEDNDVQFYWRDIAEGKTPDENEPRPSREELCRVSIGEAAKFLREDKAVRAWQWNPLEREWVSTKSARPGGVYLIAASSGGYEDSVGWTGESKVSQLSICRPSAEDSDSHDDESSSFNRQWVQLDRHTLDVVGEIRRIASALCLLAEESTALHTAAFWHDVGKAHKEFQAMLINGDASRKTTLWAKSENKNGKCARRGFRHELASALAWLLADTPHAPGKPASRERDLVAYLVASHHGKVRLSIRSLPDEPVPALPPMPDGTERLFARGIWHQHKDDAEKHDVLPPVGFGELSTPEILLDLSFMQMGEGPHGPSWLARTIALRDRLGPFRLAFLETLLRAADARASRETIK